MVINIVPIEIYNLLFSVLKMTLVVFYIHCFAYSHPRHSKTSMDSSPFLS
ncbi:hypothetical protein EXN66_Car001197 [Channa argus]|uniref:Uncharacterized protein n=1 Tax=Channa argus TaxID=215402 RepID=A0A6G1QZV8_CHAAH|nr:hypothetical protein EXN66_Car001197 [Channa argus]